MNKICICGDTRAGKTTFLKALTKIKGFPHFVSDPEWPENREFYDKGVVATSGYSHLKGELVVNEDKRYPVEFLDYPGEDFGEGFVFNGKKDEKLSSYISEGAFLYFFIEPEKVNTRNLGALVNLLNFFEKCHTKQGKNKNVCLVLTKADTCSEEELPEHTPHAVEAFIEKKASGILPAIRSLSDSFSCCAMSVVDDEMDAASRQIFFEPYFRTEDTRKRNWFILATIAILLGVIALCSGIDAFRRWDAKATRTDPKHKPIFGTGENKSNYDDKCRHQLAKFEKKAMERVNEENLLYYIEELEKLPDPDGRAKLIEHSLREKVRDMLDSELRMLKSELKNSMNEETLRRYNSVKAKYQKLFGDLPDELEFSPIEMDLPLIQKILNISNSGILSYTNMRASAISEFCDKSRSLPQAEKMIIEESVETARMLASKGKYRFLISFKGFQHGLVDDVEPAVTLSLFMYSEEDSDKIKFEGACTEKYGIEKHLEWQVGDSIYLSIWDACFPVSPDEIVYERGRENSSQRVAIHDFCQDGWFRPDWSESNERTENVMLRCNVTDPEGNLLTKERLDNVYKYVYDNVYWENLKKSLNP